MVAVSSRVMPTSDKANRKLRDASAIPGQGFSLTSVNSRLDIVPPLNKLYRIFRIPHGPRKCQVQRLTSACSRCSVAKLRAEPRARSNESTGERDRICLGSEQR